MSDKKIPNANNNTIIILGWVNYFSVADMKGILQKLDAWIRRRMRMCEEKLK